MRVTVTLDFDTPDAVDAADAINEILPPFIAAPITIGCAIIGTLPTGTPMRERRMRR